VCGKSCATAHSNGTCAGGVCIVNCDPGYADCDGLPGDGCEIDTTTDPHHCGNCSTNCSTANVLSVDCKNSKCAPYCVLGSSDCNQASASNDGCEQAYTSSSCGQCGESCVTSAHNLTCEPISSLAAGPPMTCECTTDIQCSTSPQSSCDTTSGTCRCGSSAGTTTQCVPGEVCIAGPTVLGPQLADAITSGGTGGLPTGGTGGIPEAGQDTSVTGGTGGLGGFGGTIDTDAATKGGTGGVGGIAGSGGGATGGTGGIGGVGGVAGSAGTGGSTAGEICSCNGSTACPSFSGSACCNSGCQNLMGDPQNCGACGRVCPPSFVCTLGECSCNASNPASCNNGTPGICNATRQCVCGSTTCLVGQRCQPDGKCG
jgi:hypothetical protein